MTRFAFDLYPRDDPGAGTRLVRFTQLQLAEYRKDANGTGAGKIALRSTSTDAAFIDPAGLQYVRVVLIKNDLSEVVYGGFFLENGDFAALTETSSKLLNFGGAGTLSVLQRAIAAEQSYIAADDPLDGEWRWSTQTGGEILDRMVREAQAPARPQDPLAMVTHDFDGTDDSSDTPWPVTDVDFRFPVGRDLLELARQLMAKGLFVDMDGDFGLHAWVTRGVDRTGGAWGADVVRFQAPSAATVATGNIKSEARRGLAAFVQRSDILIGNPELGYAWVPGSVGGLGLQDVDWEGFIADVSDPNSTAATAVSEAQLAARDDAGDVVRLRTRFGESPTTGVYAPGLHYDVADLVTLHNGSGTWDWDETAQIVSNVTIKLRDAGDWDVWVDLGSEFASIESRAFAHQPVGPHTHPMSPQLCQVAIPEGLTSIKHFRADDGGDALDWEGVASNQGGSGNGAEGSDFYYNLAGALPQVAQTTYAALVGTTYRVSGYWARSLGGSRELVFRFYDDAPGTVVPGAGLSETQLSAGNQAQWGEFSVDIVAPAGTQSMGLGTTGSSSFDFDEVRVQAVTPAVPGDGPADLVGTGTRAARCGHSHHLLRTTAPTVDDDEDDGYPVTTLWTDTDTGESWVLIDATAGAAVWLLIASDPTAHTGDPTDAHDASSISFAPTGTIAATDVQAAIAEVAAEAGAGDFLSIRDGGGDEVSVVAAAGATETLDLADGNVHDVTLTADCTITLTSPASGAGRWMRIFLRQDGTGGWTVTWPGSVSWPDATPPILSTAPNAVDIITLVTLDGGTTWFGGYQSGSSAVAALDDLTDVTITSPVEADRVRYDGSEWVNSNLHWEPMVDYDGLVMLDSAGGIHMHEVSH